MIRRLEMPDVSIIIPVYNVEKYFDQCMESIVNQTYTEIEIILINDGSTDNSGKLCEKWSDKDNRIKYFSKDNEGLGPTRNFGIEKASSEYVAFVDSDDWISPEFIEKMIVPIINHDLDMAICDFITFNDGEEIYTAHSNFTNGERLLIEKKEAVLFSSEIWKLICKKAIFIENKILMPALPYEDLAIYSFLASKCEKIAYIREPLYYYRKNRTGSIMQDCTNRRYFHKALKYLCNYFINDNSFDKYKQELYQLFCKKILITYKEINNNVDEDMFRKIDQSLRELLNDYFSDINIYGHKYLALGSFNLYRTISKCVLNVRNADYYCFSSLISIMSSMIDIEYKHTNSFRKEMIGKDLNKQLVDKLKINSEKYLIIDFLEERFDIFQHNASYITSSDAFNEMNETCYRKIPRFSEEAGKLWREHCLQFIDLLKSCILPEKIILVRMKLSKYYGKTGKEKLFSDIQKIEKINSLLDKYYDFFEIHMPGIKVISDVDNELFYTKETFIHGCYPYHLNSEFYYELSQRIIEVIQVDNK